MSWAQNSDLGFQTSIWEPILILVIIFMLIAVPVIVAALVFAKKRTRTAVVRARTLSVHTANLSPDSDDIMVVVTVDADAFRSIALIDAPLRLTSPDSRPVTFQPGTSGPPALDPNQGWLIPVSRDTEAELRALPAGPGEHELATTNVAFIVEP
ncbi:hypothetical protein M3G18_08985 [Corynebacterium sp. p3-SID1145]|uniref:hypothetical protein n=1 Tax=unclassified Corynebacterium TaxID=2624378 RepID=UPI0021A9ED01|nr:MULTISPECIES: hypothetical protein [unclassified Corynebacterium]MCT1453037.1 hypothetical protein [Corynebacterium sp. p3-SID1145]MCT1462021.1 hypothetical protein [Corynebacterium sp. p3-SID1140]